MLCALFQPVATEKMHELAFRLGLDCVPTLEKAVAEDMTGKKVALGDPLFPRVDPEWMDKTT